MQKSAVSAATRGRYRKAASQLDAYARQHRLPLKTRHGVDLALAALLHKWYFDGKQLGVARYLVYGTAWVRAVPSNNKQFS